MTGNPRDSTAQRIRQLLASEVRCSPTDGLSDDLPLIESRVLDSLGLLHLVEALETEFHIRIRDEEVILANFRTISRIAALVDSKSAAQ